MFGLARELSAQRVLLTTTTKLGADQTGGYPLVLSPEPDELERRLWTERIVLAAAARRGKKLVGLSPAVIDRLWGRDLVDYLLVEADGARRMQVKAPGTHEPIIPGLATLVLSVLGAGAVDRVIADVSHRPLRVAALVGSHPYRRLTVDDAARLLLDEEGGRKGLPPNARWLGLVTFRTDEQESIALAIATRVANQGMKATSIDMRRLADHGPAGQP
jgi:molybdenum cofactor cytidylyltransferase